MTGSAIRRVNLIDLSNEEAAKLLESDSVERVDLPFSGVLKTPWGDVK